jgi:4-amino-4-deoxychorismate lyase
MILVNGERKQHIETSDRGFQYGDGLFETIEVRNGQPVFLDRHLKRLNTGCHRLHIPCPDPELLTAEALILCKNSSLAVLKLIVTRGSGGRGYRQPDLIQPTRVLSLHPYPDYPPAYRDQGIVARFCDTRLGLNPSLAGIKHMNRLEQILARAEWNDPAIQEGIMLDINDHIIEGTMTNLFYVKNGSVYTASLSQSGVAGIMRGIIIEILSNHNVQVFEKLFNKNEFLSADEIFASNSIIGLWPINQIGNNHFSIGPITRRIQSCLDRIKSEAEASLP